MSSVVIRRGDRLDAPFLRSLLSHAYHWHVSALETDVPIARYVEGWGRRGDVAVVAMDEGHSVGAAWYRLFQASDPGYGFVDEETPELTLVVVPSRQGEGVGAQLLDALLQRARSDGYAGLSVSVERGNSEADLFLASGFEPFGEHGDTVVLRCPLQG